MYIYLHHGRQNIGSDKILRRASSIPLDNGIYLNPNLSTHLPKEAYRLSKEANETTAQVKDYKLQITSYSRNTPVWERKFRKEEERNRRVNENTANALQQKGKYPLDWSIRLDRSEYWLLGH